MTLTTINNLGSNPRVAERPIRVVFCWSLLSGYMAACWKALARRPDVEIHVIAHGGEDSHFPSHLLEGLPHRIVGRDERGDTRLITSIVAEQAPDVVAMTGWWLPAYRKLPRARQLRDCRFIMGVDSPWRHEGQFLTRLRYLGTLPLIDHFFVTGERAWQYVSRLGVPAARISRGMYGVDTAAWAKSAAARSAGPWPRRFLFLGRYASEKAVDVLVAAYAEYRRQASSPWELICCGTGPLSGLFKGQPGIRDIGFHSPDQLHEVFSAAGAFVLPSRFDPWPLALVEAASAGLPLLCSDACGSAVEVLRPHYNGFIVPSESPAALAEAMAAIASREDDLRTWGVRSQELAAPYSSEFWADRWLDQIRRLA